jgi:acetoin utilization protein AcuB
MNVLQPVSTIMSSDLKTANPTDKLEVIKKIFDENNIHHIPVVRHMEIIGIISKSDFLHYLHGFRYNSSDDILEASRLSAWKAEDIMTKKLAKVEKTDPIRTALQVFKLNRFHAIPVVDKGKLVGIVTTYDIINAIASEPIELSNYQDAKPS